MKQKYLLSILFVQFRLFEVYPLFVRKKVSSEKFDPTKFIEYSRGQQECLQIVLDTKQQPPLSLIPSNTSVQIRSHKSIKLRDISTEQEGQCETFLIFAKTIEMVIEIFQFSGESFVKQFFPFTSIYLYLVNRQNYTANAEALLSVRQFLVNNALFGYVFEYNDNESNVVVRDLLSNEVKRQPASQLPNELSHPMVDTNLVKNDFRISLFNCTPYTIYPQHENEDDTLVASLEKLNFRCTLEITLELVSRFINALDGIEFRFVREVTKNWKKTYKFRDFSRVKSNPYAAILDDLANKSSDMSMCALWIIDDIYSRYDLSTFYVKQCVMFLVPKPMKLPEATAIYTTLEGHVWLLFLLVFLLAIVFLNNIAKLEKQMNGSDSDFTDLTVTVLETLNAATSHSVAHFPNDQASVKVVLISWILLSTCMGISYTTIYASRLASPTYEKPINTVRQMLDKGLYICNAYFDESMMEPLSQSINVDYREMGKRSIVYGENAKLRRQLFTERKCAVVEVRLTNNYISLLKFEGDLDLVSIFRPTKQCTYTHYTGFVFPKHSPYTKLFNWHIRKYQENGIAQKWNSELLHNAKAMRTLFDDYPERDRSHHIIQMINVSGAFLLLWTGLFLSLVAFFIEIMKHRRDQRNVSSFEYEYCD